MKPSQINKNIEVDEDFVAARLAVGIDLEYVPAGKPCCYGNS
jgi:hypothetical protein